MQRVLLIDDHIDTLSSTAMLLRLMGYSVETAPTGKEGLEKASQFNPAVILCDINITPEMNGYAVAKALRANPQFSKTLLIAFTGYGYEQDKQRALQSGFDMHMTKPGDLTLLEQAIKKHFAA